MEIIVTKNYEESSALAARMMADLVKAKPNAKLGLATGSTFVPVYANLVQLAKEESLDFSKVTSVNLDEYVGMDPANHLSYRYFMNSNLFDHINIDKANTYVASGTGNVEDTIKEFRGKVKEGGYPDIQVLGVGVSGHIGFNEAGEKLHCQAHQERLEQSTIDANSRFFTDKSQVPASALTMGVGEIMCSGQLLLVASGAAKATAIRGLIMDAYVTTQNPCTILKMHPNAVVIIDQPLADLVGYKG